MTNKVAGYAIGLAAIGMMFGLLAIDISKLTSWSEMTTPSFIGGILAHLATVISAFIGGKLIPTEPQNQRETDPQPKSIKIANPWEGGG